MLKSLLVLFATIASIALFTATASAGADLRLQATMRGGSGGAKAVAKYEERPRGSLVEQRFKVQVERMVKGSVQVVTVNGVTLGSITVNAFGRGELDLRVNSDNPGTNVPSLPHMQAGDIVTVGALSGVFAPN